jgi:hypothetical protein
LLNFPWLGYPDTPERLRLPFSYPFRVNGFNHRKPTCRTDGFYSVNAGGFLALVVLGHSSDG